MTPLRVLIVIRLSRSRDESTSVVRQRETCRRWAEAQGAIIVGEAVDLDVSGAVPPNERPSLGLWLSGDPAEQWDVMVSWRLDRVSRSARDTVLLLDQLAGRHLVTVSDGIDTRGPMGRVFVTLAAVFAELERSVLTERTRDGKAALIADGRWTGGPVPFGYRVVGAKGDQRLAVDPKTGPVVAEMFERRADGATFSDLSRWLGKPSKTVRTQIRDRKYAGIAAQPALVDPEMWERAQGKTQVRKRADSGLLAGLVICGVCNKNLWVRRIETGPRYQCQDGGAAHTLQIPEDILLELMVIETCAAFGDEEIQDTFVRPDTSASEIARCRLEIAQATERLGKPGADRAAVLAEVTELSSRLDALEARPKVDRVEQRGTGRRWRDVTDPSEMAEELRRRGYRVAVRLTSRAPETIEVRPIPPEGDAA